MPRQKTKDVVDSCHQNIQTDKCSDESSQKITGEEQPVLVATVQRISDAVDTMLPLMERMCALLEQQNRETEREMPCPVQPVTSRLWQWNEVLNYPVDYVHPALDAFYGVQPENVGPGDEQAHTGSNSVPGAYTEECAKQIPTHEFLEELVTSSMTDDSRVEQDASARRPTQDTTNDDM